MEGHIQFANHPLMYLGASFGIILVLIQGTYILLKAKKAAQEIGMDQEKIKKGMKVAALSSIGPALGILGSILSLIVSLGAPVSALRLSVIGGTNYETMAATFGAKAAGGELAPIMDPKVYANALWVPAIGVMGWIIVTFLFGHRMEKINNLLTGGRKELLPAVSLGAMLGAFAYFVMNNIINIKLNPAYAAASIGGLCIMVICHYLGKKINWINSWGLSFAMFGGALIGMIFV